MPQLVNQSRNILNQLLPLGEPGLVLVSAGLVLAVEFGELVNDAGEDDGPPLYCGRVPVPVRWISQHGSVSCEVAVLSSAPWAVSRELRPGGTGGP